MGEFSTETITINHWKVLIRQAEGSHLLPVYVLLHGWTGDEKSMWVFTKSLPKEAFYIAPRGLYPTPKGGYSWYADQSFSWPDLSHFFRSATELDGLLTEKNFYKGDFSRMYLIGFSQGAALAFAYTYLYPERVKTVASLSGFLPDGLDMITARKSFGGKPIFLAHGSQDVLVPIERARSTVDILEKAGGKVTYCEDDVGHKLSASCFRGLEAFLAGQECN